MRLICLLAIGLAFISGCGGSDKPNADSGVGGSPTVLEGMNDLSALLKELDKDKKKAPSKVSDMESYEPIHPGAYLSLLKGEIVYAWGTLLTGGTAVVAYEKDAATNGGYVLLQDGTVKKMTAQEFAAAEKLKKK